MAILKKAVDAVTGKKKNKFFHDLKDWVISPGGIVTIVLIIIVIAVAEHRYEKKK